MNILAHLYLSNGINDIMLGNFMGDFVKGAKYNNYPDAIRQGILLHRAIDDFTDKHEMHKITRDRLRSKYGLHSGIVTDILFDHFLSKHWDSYHEMKLSAFTSETYAYLLSKIEVLPSRLQIILPIMVENNWLELYGKIEGMERVLKGMSRRTSLPNHTSFAISVLEENYDEMYQEFDILFNELINLASNNIKMYKFASN